MSFSTSPTNVTVDRGQNASFTCTYLHTDVNISWNGPGVEAGVTMSMMSMGSETNSESKTSNLAITNVNSSHVGEYFCTARISEDMVVNSTEAYLIVECKYITRKVIVCLLLI